MVTKAQALYASAFFVVLFALFTGLWSPPRAEAIPPPPMPFCEWEEDHNGVGQFVGNTAKVHLFITCNENGIDGCYYQAVATLYAWIPSRNAWVPVTNVGNTGVRGPNCDSGLNQITFQSDMSTYAPGTYTLTATAYDKTFGTEKMCTGSYMFLWPQPPG